MTEIRVVSNALALVRLTRLREAETGAAEFRRVLRDLSSMLVYEAMGDASLAPTEIQTPMGPTVGVRLETSPMLVPVLRAGLGMLDAALELLGDVPVSFLGMVRNERTLEARRYASTLPADLDGRDAMVLDPMLATGGTFCHVFRLLRNRGAGRVIAVTVIASPEGIEAVRRSGLADAVYVTAIDESLNDAGFILPGLGDAGDRQYGARTWQYGART